MKTPLRFSRFAPLLAAGALLAAIGTAAAQALPPPVLIEGLRSGGYVIVMRHASSPATPPTKANAAPGNARLERQLDANGQATAKAMGEALKKLRIPIGNLYASPTYRALETVRFGQFGKAQTFPALGDGGKSMAPVTDEARTAFLRAKAAEVPRKGTDTLVVTHAPNIAAAFGDEAANTTDGEALVFQPDGKGGTTMVARIRIGDWPKLVD